ncbi:hypothetical protein BDY21DRAFT_267273, partial [Lineolata rhizophorae]
VSSSLPDEVVNCLQNARFLHLATCSANTPHISLMNYTYLPTGSPFSPYPSIVMTTPPSSRKTANLQSNPLVSLLVHDWVSHRPPTLSQSPASQHQQQQQQRSASPPPPQGAPRSSLANLLLGINTAALSRISATINGEARLVDPDTPEEKWCKDMHLANNTFDTEAGGGSTSDTFGTSPPAFGHALFPRASAAGESEVGDGGRGCFIEGEQVRVVVVRIRNGRIVDWKGGVRDWEI